MRPGAFVAWKTKRGDPDIEPIEFDSIARAIDYMVEYEYVTRLGKFLYLEDDEGVIDESEVRPLLDAEIARRDLDVEIPKKPAKRYPDARFLVQVQSPGNMRGERSPEWQLIRATDDGGNAAFNFEKWCRILGTDRVRIIDRLVEGVDQ